MAVLDHRACARSSVSLAWQASNDEWHFTRQDHSQPPSLSSNTKLAAKGLPLSQQDRSFVLKLDHSLPPLDAVCVGRPHADTSTRVEAKQDHEPQQQGRSSQAIKPNAVGRRAEPVTRSGRSVGVTDWRHSSRQPFRRGNRFSFPRMKSPSLRFGRPTARGILRGRQATLRCAGVGCTWPLDQTLMAPRS